MSKRTAILGVLIFATALARAAAAEAGYGLSPVFTIDTAWQVWPGVLDRDHVGEGLSPVFTVNTRWQVWRGDFSYTGIGTGVSGLFTANTAFAELCGTGVSNVFAVDTQLPTVELVGMPWSMWVEPDRLRITATVRNSTNRDLDVWLGASLRRDVELDTIYYDDPPRDVHFSVPPGESTIVRYFYTDEGYSQQFAHLFETLPAGASFDLVTRLYVDWVPVSDMTDVAADYLSLRVTDDEGNVPAFAASRLIVQRYDAAWAFLDERAADAAGQVTFAEEEVTPDATYGYQAYYERPNPFDAGVGEFWAETTAVADGVTHLVDLPRTHPYVNDAQFLVDDVEVTVEVPAAVGDTVTPRIWLTHDMDAARNVSVRLLFSRDWQTLAYDRTVNVAIPVGTSVSVDFPDFTPDEAGLWYAAWKVTDSNFGKTDCRDWTAAFEAEAGPRDYAYWTTKRQVGCTPYAVTGNDWDTDFSTEEVDYGHGARINVSHMIGSGGDATYRFTLPATSLVTYTRMTLRIRGRASDGDGAPDLELGAIGRDWSGVGAAEDTYDYVIEAPDDPAAFLAAGPEAHLATFDVVIKPGGFHTYLVDWLELEVEGTFTNPLLEQYLFVTTLENALAQAETLMGLWEFADHDAFAAAAAEGVAILGKWLQDAAPGPAAASGTGLPIDDVIFGARDTLHAMIMTAEVIHDTQTFLDDVANLFTAVLERQEYELGWHGESNRFPSEIAADIASARSSLTNLAAALLAAGEDGVLAPDEAGALAAAGADLDTAISRLETVKSGMTDFGKGMGNFLENKTTEDDMDDISTYRGALDTFGHLVQYHYPVALYNPGTPQEYLLYTDHDATPVPEKSYLWAATDTLDELRTTLAGEADATERLITGHVTEGVAGLSGVTVRLNTEQETSTNYNGYYSILVEHGATVTVEFQRPGYEFNPATTNLGAVTTDRGGVDSEGAPVDYRVSGQVTAAGVGIGGVTVSGLPGTVVTDAEGMYEVAVDYGWNGVIQPQLAGIAFSPAYRLTGTVSADLPDQDFAAVDDGFEPNDDAQHPAALGSGTQDGLFCFNPDFYALIVPAMSDLDVTVTVGAGNEALALALFDPAGQLLGEMTSTNGVAAVLYDWTVQGAYAIRVQSPSGAPLPYSLSLAVTDSAPRIVTPPQAQTVVYGENVNLSVSAEGRGLSYDWQRNGTSLGVHTAELTLDWAAVADSGDYACEVSNAGGTVVSDEARLTVSKRTLTVTAQNASRLYGDLNPEFSVEYSGFIGGDGAGDLEAAPVPTCSATATSPVGAYAIVPGGGTDDNYAFNAVPGALNVNKRPLTASADNKTRAYGAPNPAFTLTYDGLVAGDVPEDVDVPPTVTCGATGSSLPGAYTIEVAHDGSDNNYSFAAWNNGTLSVTNGAPVIDQAGPLSVTMDEDGLPAAWTAPALSASDDGAGTLSWSVVQTPAHGGTATVSGTGASPETFLYTPAADWSGSDNFTVQVADGYDGGADTVTVNVTVSPRNDAPVLDLDAETAGLDFAAAFVEDGGPVSIMDAEGPSIVDVDDTELESARVVITNLLDGTAEVLNAEPGATGIAVAYDPGTGVLTLTGPAALADYQSVLRTVTYNNTSQDPDTTARLIEFTVNDGDTDSAIATSTVSVTALNDAPVVDLNGGTDGVDYAATFTEDGGAVSVGDPAALSVTDVDDTELESATVTITNVPDGAAESLSADTGGRAVTASYDPGTGILSLTGTASVSEYQTVLRTVTYNNTSADPDTTARVVTFVANDGAADSAVATCTVTVAAENDAPVITGQETLSTPEETALAITRDDLRVSDPDNTYPAEFTLTVQDGADYSRAGNTITPAAQFNGELTVPVVVNDGTADSNSFNLAVTVTAVTDAPVIMGQEVLTTPEQTALTITFADLHVTDPDSAYPSDFTLTVRDGANYTRSGATITPAVDFNGELTVPVSVNDGGLDSNVYALTVSVTAVNDAPVLDLDAETAGLDFAAAFVEDGGPVSIMDAEGPSIVDVDDTELESARVVITNRLDDTAEALNVSSPSRGIVSDYDQTTGTLFLTGTATLAEYESVLRTVTYTNASDAPATSARIVEFTVNDGENDSATAVAVVCFMDVIKLEIHPGWGLVSLPFGIAENKTPADVLIDDEGMRLFAGNLWSWDAKTKRYARLDKSLPGKVGFWI